MAFPLDSPLECPRGWGVVWGWGWMLMVLQCYRVMCRVLQCCRITVLHGCRVMGHVPILTRHMYTRRRPTPTGGLLEGGKQDDKANTKGKIIQNDINNTRGHLETVSTLVCACSFSGWCLSWVLAISTCNHN